MKKYFIKAAVFNIFLAICGCWPIYYVPRDHRKQNERILFFLFFKGLQRRKVDKEWDFEERDIGHVICSSGADSKNPLNQSKDRQTTSFFRM